MSEFADRNNKELYFKGHYCITGTFAQKIKEINASHSFIYTDGLLAIDSTDGEVVLTLPLMAEIEQREYRHVFPVVHIKGDNNVKIMCGSGETFANGATFFNLGKGLFCFDLFVLQTATYSTFGLHSRLDVKAASTFAGTFGYASFVTTPAIVPFDTEKYNTQDEMLLLQTLSNGSIASAADGSVAGTVECTDTAHGLITGDVITQAGTTEYDGEYEVTVLTVDVYSIVETFTSTVTGTWIRSPRFTALVAGDYKLGYQMTVVCDTGAAVLTSGIYKNGSALDDTAVVLEVITGGTGVLALSDVMITLAAGDVIDLRALQAGLSAGNLTLGLLSIETTV